MTPSHSSETPLEDLRGCRPARRALERGRFVAEGEDLIAAAAPPGGAPLEATGSPAAVSAGGRRIGRGRRRARRGLDARLGHARDRRLRAALGARPAGRSASSCAGCAIPATSARSCAPRRRSGHPAWRSGPTAPTRTRRRRCARPWARSSPCALARFSAWRSCPARRRSRWAGARRADGAARRRAGDAITLLVGGERTGLPAGAPRAVRRSRRAIRQIAGDSLNAAMAATVALYEMTRMAASRVSVMIDRIARAAGRSRGGDRGRARQRGARGAARALPRPQGRAAAAPARRRRARARGARAPSARPPTRRARRSSALIEARAAELRARGARRAARERPRRRDAAGRAAAAGRRTCT